MRNVTTQAYLPRCSGSSRLVGSVHLLQEHLNLRHPLGISNALAQLGFAGQAQVESISTCVCAITDSNSAASSDVPPCPPPLASLNAAHTLGRVHAAMGS